MKISVITINYNDRDGLLKTVQSVVGQTVAPYEFIVIDGGSTDGSMAILEDYREHFSYCVSEPDEGIYNAMNKGIDKATGEWCLFLNSGDSFCHEKVLEQLESAGVDADIICGNVNILSDPPRLKKAPESVSLDYLFGSTICHQGALIHTSILKKYHYDEKYRIVADRKLFVQALILDGASYAPIDVDIADYDITGMSSMNRTPSEQEYRRVLEELIPARILVDYGRRQEGALYGMSSYEKLFLEIGKRKWRKPVECIVRCFLRVSSLFFKSARFEREIK